MAPSMPRTVTPDGENDASLATPRAKPMQLLNSRQSMSNITNSVSSKRILASQLDRAVKESLKSAVRHSNVSTSSDTPAKYIRSRFAAGSASTAATPQPRRKRTDAEPAAITPRPQAFDGGLAEMRRMQSVADIPRLTSASASNSGDDTARLLDVEPVKAYLRIRPPPQDAQKQVARPYIEVVSDTEVLMHPPAQAAYNTANLGVRSRAASIAPPTKYIFSKVFGSQTSSMGEHQDMSQSAFFQHTTLPLVEALLQGESGLMFTYGVTNSGKSHTVMGNSSPGGAGILPRALDVIFNSIQGLESTANIQPVGVSGVQRADPQSAQAESSSNLGINPFMIPSVSRRLLQDSSGRAAKPSKLIEHDSTKVTVDKNLRYSVFVSYVEIYNEKLYDLLDVSPNNTLGRSESVRGSNWSLATMANAAPSSIPSSASIFINRRALMLKNDQDNGGKYVAGLREIKITSADEARDLLHRGQENRAVFGTMANRASSRSHGIFTIKVIRHHGGLTSLSQNDLDSFTTARLSIVDLAGSERVANTGLASGERLKEAGNINKSLMCLGQCLETLRKNQVRLMGSTEGGQAQTVKRRISIVPFRHSKLTELFQSFFVGEGKAVMIVNANPYDTGFDENSHVMKFSAIAKEVAVSRHLAPVTKNLPPLPQHEKQFGSSSRIIPKSRSTMDVSATDSEASADVTIIEDDEESGDEDSDPFVDMLLERHEDLRQKLYAAELRCATIEAQVREEMANELEQRLLEMQDLYNSKMLNDAEENERFMNRKIDLLVSTNARNEPDLIADSDADEQDTDASDVEYEEGYEEEDEGEVEDALVPSRRVQDTLMSDISGRESEFDDATEGEVSHSMATEDESEGDSELDVETSAILKPGRQGKAAASTQMGGSESDESENDEESQDDAPEPSKSSNRVGLGGSDDSDEDEDEVREDDDASKAEESAAEEGDVSQVQSGSDAEESEDESDNSNGEDDDDGEYFEDRAADAIKNGEICIDAPELSVDSISSVPSTAASDASFNLDASSESEDERPAARRKKSNGRASTVGGAGGARGSNGSAATARAGRRSSNKPRTSNRDASILVEASNLTDLSDASMVMEEAVTPKKKRKFGKKLALQEDDFVEQVGDSSLVEAVYSQSAAGNSSRASRSFASRKSRASRN